jgi:hypothetical protein
MSEFELFRMLFKIPNKVKIEEAIVAVYEEYTELKTKCTGSFTYVTNTDDEASWLRKENANLYTQLDLANSTIKMQNQTIKLLEKQLSGEE